MSQTLLVAIAITLPLAGLAWLAAMVSELAGAGVRTRLAAWTLALVLPALAPGALLGVQALQLTSPLALANLAPARPTAVDASALTPAPIVDGPRNRLPVAPTAIVLAVLAAGAGVRMTGLILALGRLSKLIARSAPVDEDERRRLGLAPGDRCAVRISSHDTPMLAGVLRPVILLPRALTATLSPAQAALVCAHECAHLRAGDHIAHLVEEIIVRLYWFNPLIGVVRERLDAVREEACDARTLGAAPEPHRRAYAEALLAAMRLSGRPAPAAAFTGLRKHGAAHRFRAILRPTRPRTILGVALTGLAAAGLTTATGGAAWRSRGPLSKGRPWRRRRPSPRQRTSKTGSKRLRRRPASREIPIWRRTRPCRRPPRPTTSALSA